MLHYIELRAYINKRFTMQNVCGYTFVSYI